MQRFLGKEVCYFRPADRFDNELSYIAKGLEGNAFDCLVDWIIETYDLNQQQLESIDTHLKTVQDLVELLCFLSNQSPGKVDFSSFLRNRNISL